MSDSTMIVAAVPLVIGGAWYLIAPVIVSAGNPRIRQRNPDHYGRLVRYSRMWGLVAVVVGVAVAFVR